MCCSDGSDKPEKRKSRPAGRRRGGAIRSPALCCPVGVAFWGTGWERPVEWLLPRFDVVMAEKISSIALKKC